MSWMAVFSTADLKRVNQKGNIVHKRRPQQSAVIHHRIETLYNTSAIIGIVFYSFERLNMVFVYTSIAYLMTIFLARMVVVYANH